MYKQVNYPEIKCKWCNLFFKPNRKDKHFCSKSCYKQYGKKHKGHSNGNKETLRHKNRPYLKYRKLVCERCGFLPEHPCQLDVDHIDGNHSNNLPENLQTLCACCHRLKTAKQLGWLL